MMIRSLVLSAALAIAACGGDDDHMHGEQIDCSELTGFDEYSPGLQKPGAVFTTTLVAADPAPPARGFNAWSLEVSDGSGPVGDMAVEVTPFMPHHGHGTDPVTVEPGATDGMYELSDIDLFMPGIWETTIDLDDGSGTTDSVLYTFCIDG